MTTPPARLTTEHAQTLIDTMRQGIEAIQSARTEGRYIQVRRGNIQDRRDAGLPNGDYDQYDIWIDEYLGRLGRGWEAHVEIPTTSEENDDGVARSWRYSLHVGPETHRDYPDEWYPLPVEEGE